MKVYLVSREENGNVCFTTFEKIFSTLEKAQAYVKELEEKYKNTMWFELQHLSDDVVYFEIEEMEVE